MISIIGINKPISFGREGSFSGARSAPPPRSPVWGGGRHKTGVSLSGSITVGTHRRINLPLSSAAMKMLRCLRRIASRRRVPRHMFNQTPNLTAAVCFCLTFKVFILVLIIWQATWLKQQRALSWQTLGRIHAPALWFFLQSFQVF